MKAVGLEYVFTFGKHKGRTASAVIERDPGYILWAHDNTEVKFNSDLITDAFAAKESIDTTDYYHFCGDAYDW